MLIMCFSSACFIGLQLTEDDIMRSLLDDDDRVYWYHLMLPDVHKYLVSSVYILSSVS